MKTFFNKFAYTTCFMFGLIFGLLMIPVGYISYELFIGVPIQTLNSQQHTATLRPINRMLGYHLVVEVDGKQVYRSGKSVGTSERQLRATLVWDTTGRIVAFEILGKIKFAYNAEERREIDQEELKKYCLSPMPEEYTKKNQSCNNQN